MTLPHEYRPALYLFAVAACIALGIALCGLPIPLE